MIYSRVVAFVLVGALPILAAGCNLPGTSSGTTSPGSKPTTVAVVYLDISVSTNKSRALYRTWFKSVARAFAPGTLVETGEITKSPQRDATGFHSDYLQRVGESQQSVNSLFAQRQNSQAIADAARHFDEISRRDELGNSILDALTAAQNVFTLYPSATTRYLIIFSDMVEYSPRLRFTPRNLQPAEIKALIRKDRRDGRLPDLHGVQVYAFGAGATGKPYQHVAARTAEAFWMSYFGAAHAQLRPNHYVPGFIAFP